MMKHALDDFSNPYQGVTTRDRLSEISHFFLSSEEERTPQWQNTLIMPILLTAKQDDFIAYDMAKAMEHLGKTCLVLNVETQAGQASKTPSAATEAPDVCLIPLTTSRTTLALQGDKLLLTVPSSLAGVRLAYNHLAQLASLGRDVVINVIMLEAEDSKSAMRFFRFLCNSARDFLALEIKCGGIILRDTAQETSGGASETPVGMTAIAETLMRKKTLASPKQAATPPLPALSF